MQLKNEPAVVATWAGSIVVALAIANAATLWLEFGLGYDVALGLVTMFRLTREANVPTLFSSVAWLLVGTIFLLVGLVVRRQSLPHPRAWLALSAIFSFLAIDEAAQIHEMLDRNRGWPRRSSPRRAH